MSIAAVFRHDQLDIRRSKLMWGVLSVYLLFMVATFYGAIAIKPTMESAVGFLFYIGTFVVPVTALVSASLTIAGARESGRVRFLLGFPNDRSEIVVGMFLSRVVLIAGSLLIAFAVVGLLAVISLEQARLELLAQFMLLTILYAIAYVSLAIGISASAASQARAITGAMGSFLVLNVLWSFFSPWSVVDVLRNLLGNQLGLDVPAAVYVLAEVVNPVMAYLHAIQPLGPAFTGTAKAFSSAPHLASPMTAIGILLAWIAVPLALGYGRFRIAEIE